MVQAYKVLGDSPVGEAKKDEIVYSFSGHDYGLASYDTRMTGAEHVSVTRKRNGGTPSFTIPRNKLQSVPMPPNPSPLTDNHVMEVCKPGEKEVTCRYLAMDSKGWDCLKHSNFKWELDNRVEKGTIVAQGDNCEGKYRD